MYSKLPLLCQGKLATVQTPLRNTLIAKSPLRHFHHTTMSPSKVPRTNDGSTLLIPGPITLSPAVIDALGEQSVSHTSPAFAGVFQDALHKLRQVYQADTQAGTPLVLSGSGTLGFDVLGGNLVRDRTQDKILVLSTGFFSDELHDALAGCYVENPERQVTRLAAKRPGDSIPLAAIEAELQREQYALVAMTQVDTSTGVLLDVQGVAEIAHRVSPETLVAVDTVCSLGCEEIKFKEWGLDMAFSASQKAVGAPPGLCLGMLSERAVQVALENTSAPGYYTSLKRWMPVLRAFESGKAAYFATPPVQLIDALDVALTEILDTEFQGLSGVAARVAKHRDTSDRVKRHCTESLGLQLVSGTLENSAHGLTAVYVPQPPQTIAQMHAQGYTIAGGIHSEIKTQYIRIGHMGVSACDDKLGHIAGCLGALDKSV